VDKEDRRAVPEEVVGDALSVEVHLRHGAPHNTQCRKG
jgi:hypothetical protein